MFTFETSRFLRDRGGKFVFVGLRGSPLFDRHAREGLPTIGLPGGGLAGALRVRALLKEHPQSVLVCERLRDLPLLRVALIGLNHPLVGFAHSFIGVKKRDWYHRWTHGRLSRLVAFTEAQRTNLLETTPVKEGAIDVFPHGVDLARFSPAPERTENPNRVVVGVVGRLDVQKGQRDLLEAIALLNDPRVELWLVGDETLEEPGEKAVLSSLAEKMGLAGRVRFIPFQEKIEDVMRELDVFVMPSYQETFGRVLIEAMACGLPCIATRAGGVPSILEEGRVGLMARSRDPADLCDQVRHFVDSPSERRRFGRLARASACERFDQKVFLERLWRVLHGRPSSGEAPL